MTEITLAPMRYIDLREIVVLERECFSVPWTQRMLEDELSNPFAIYFTARQDGELAGYGGVHVILDEAHITNVATAPGLRRRGVGRTLVRGLLDIAREKGAATAMLEARVSNRAAIALYEGFGFKIAGKRPGYYEKPREDAVLMNCTL